MRGGDVDRTIERLALDKNRVVRWRDLARAGVSRRSVDHRVAIGRLHRMYSGVYVLDPPHAASRLTILTAAVVACGDNALLSHRSAAELWEMLPPHPGDIHVTVIGAGRRKRARLRQHRVSELPAADIRERRGIAVTSPARTILDNARDPDLEEMVAAAIAAGRVTTRQIELAIERYPTRRGARRLRALLDQDGGARRTRSWAERRLLSLVREAGLPVPLTNRLLLGFQVDALWPEQRLVVEVDSLRWHGDRDAFERDRARDAVLISHGYRVLRFTARQLREQPLLVIGQVAATLALASATNERTSAA